MLSRRTALLGLCFAASAAAPSLAGEPASRLLRFHGLHTGEALDVEYLQHGAHPADALDAIAHVLRDHRTGETHPIDIRLLDLLYDLSLQLETPRPFQVISGYRSPRTNAALADASSGVARGSLHMQGMAIDIAIEGVSTDSVRRAALALGRGGVGHYPNPGFVHVDVGRVRQW
jgi:uncharacterized protein YcbK (DUF882 family)